ncbi:MAG TPA: glycosyltransferase [Anaeromyxobacteraceae bacterium]|nr:glycosyltransferase [Anaeromyxobacteraceae bacterium]
MAWLLLAAVGLLAWLRVAWVGVRTDRVVDRLPGVSPDPPAGGWPSLAVVVPARDEERGVEAAVRSLLDQDYPALQVVAVDDRSTDATGAILDRLASEEPRLRVVHVTELPAGWLGKNRACAVGAAAAAGEWLLFADGDVVFAPDALRRAVAYACRNGLGHLAVLPRLVAPGLLERAFVSTFAALANPGFRTWELRRPRTAGFIGIGAFALVRRDAYERCGGHGRLRLEAVDDVKLGLVLRRSGVPQGAVDGGGLVSVRWNHGFLASWLGLVKNAFAGTEYRWGVTLLAAAGLLAASLGPALAAAAAPDGAARAVGLLGWLSGAAVVGAVARRFGGGRGPEGLLLPVTGTALAAVLVASAAWTTARGGITWRDTRYPLRELRAGCVRVRDWPPDASVGWDPPSC